jgi:hypothetical protein
MPEPKVFKGVYGESPGRQQVNRTMTTGVIMQVLSVVVALAVAAHGVVILVAVYLAWSWEPAIGALVLFGVAALVAAPTRLYRNEEVRGAALICAGLLFAYTVFIAVSIAVHWEALEEFGIGVILLLLAMPVVVTALSAAAILVCKTWIGLKSR